MNNTDQNSTFKQDLTQFLKSCCHSIQANSNDDVILDGTALFLQRLNVAKLKEFEPTQQPVVAEIDTLIPTPLISNFSSLATQIKWRPSPRTDFDAKVMALCALNEMLNLGDLVAGLLFMTPEQAYPEHQHPPQETYFIISGNSDWKYGGSEEYHPKLRNDVVYNHPRDLHGIKTREESLLALYFLWGDRAGTYSF